MSDRARITTVFDADTAPLKGGMKEVEGKAKGMADVFKGVGAAIGAAFGIQAVVSFTKELFKGADAIDNMSKRLGIGVESVQSLGIVAEEAGLSMGDFEAAILRMDRASAEAQTGNKQMIKAFNDLGISITELSGMSPEQLFDRVSVAIKDGGDAAEVTAAAYDVMGSSGGKLFEVIKQIAGDGGLQALNQAMLDAARISDESVIAALDRAEDAYGRLWQRIKTGARTLIAIPSILGEALADVTGNANEHIAEQEKQIAAMMGRVNQLKAEEAQEETKINEAKAAQAALYEKIAALQKRKNDDAEKAKSDEQRLTELTEQRKGIQERLNQYYNTQNISQSQAVDLETEEYQLSKQIEEIERRIAKEHLPEQLRLKKELADLDAQFEQSARDAAAAEQRLYEIQRDRNYENADYAGKQMILNGELLTLQQNMADALATHGSASAEYLKSRVKVAEKEDEIAALLKTQGTLAEGVAQTWGDMTSDQADTLIKLRDALADMSEEDIDKFLAKLAALAKALTTDPALQGKLPPMLLELGKFLESITGFKLPSMTSGQMGQMGIGGALSAFIQALKISPEDMAVIQELGALGLDKILDPISKFKVPNFPPRMADQLGRAIANLIAGIGPIPAGGIDLSFLQQLSEFKLPKNFTENDATKFAASIKKIVDAFSGANAGAISALAALFEKAGPGGALKITVEGGENLPDSIPITWPSDSIDLSGSGLATEATLAGIKSQIASMKGVVWK